jgi:predicted thioesterase
LEQTTQYSANSNLMATPAMLAVVAVVAVNPILNNIAN